MASANTDAEGTYMFTLEPGSYTIQANGLYYETVQGGIEDPFTILSKMYQQIK